MAGGLISIISQGIGDLFLVGNPQITFFRVVYRSHTNFAKECITVGVDNLTFGQEVQIPIDKVGDLVGEIYLQVTLPMVSFLQTTDFLFGVQLLFHIYNKYAQRAYNFHQFFLLTLFFVIFQLLMV